MNTWNLRTEILAAAQRWYWVVASFLIGALLGWLVSLVWPAPYRAIQDIYVGLNAHRATRDLYVADVGKQQFRNLDDYKNWQMEQLNTLAMSDAYLTETLTLLQLEDDYWKNLEVPEFRTMLAISWRNTGDWHFSAQADNPNLARRAVSVWSQVVTEETALATVAAREMVEIDLQMQENFDDLVNFEARQVLLQETQKTLDAWQTLIAAEPDDQPLSVLMHWELYSLVTNAASWNIGWQNGLETAPKTGSLPADYMAWLAQVMTLIETELGILPVQISALTNEYDALAEKYAIVADDSRGLSDNLEVGSLNSEPPKITQIRPTGVLMLIGGVLGLLVLGITWLVQITRRTE